MNERVAIPLFGSEIAPRFGFAQRFLLADLEEGCVRDRLEIDVSRLGWHRRLVLLEEQGVTLLLVGGFNRRFLPYAESLGVSVSWGHTGPVDALLEQLCRGALEPVRAHAGPGATGLGPCAGRGPGRGGGRGRGRRGSGARRGCGRK